VLAKLTRETVFGPVTRGQPPKRRRNAEIRPREYLTGEEAERLIAAAGQNRHGHRDATMVLLAYRHGLRVSELVSLRWDQIDFRHSQIHVARVKGSAASVPCCARPRARRLTARYAEAA
jgi:integrase